MIQKMTQKMIRGVACCTACLLLAGGSGYAQKKTFTRDYTYQASEDDSKNTSRAIAMREMRNALLREVGEFLHTEKTLTKKSSLKDGKEDFSEDYSVKIEAITAGIVEMKVMDERWDGKTYYVEAQMTVDPEEVNRKIAELLNDKQKTKELEDAHRRAQAAEAEVERLKEEMSRSKNNQALQSAYRQQADKLTAEEYFTQGFNAQEKELYELAIEYYQQAIVIDPSYANAYNNMGTAYHELGNYQQALSCYQKAIAIDPKDAMAYYNMGVAYQKLGNYQQTISCLQKAAQLKHPAAQEALRSIGYSW
jgi:tetratricopeptide (TPR) repeat protein